ncbi:MAG: hypothetical protein JNK78_19070 [Planctomycetes bacterium]|nr:hypothetical protein [Planctomycetota bacterium]
MAGASLTLKKLAERVLAGSGELPLALLLEHLVSVDRLRDLARKHGLSPKGGFRIDKAPAHVLAPLLAEQRESDRVDEVLALLVPEGRSEAKRMPKAPSTESAASPDAAAVLALREAEIVRLRDDLERARESAARAQKREGELTKRLEDGERDMVVLRQQVERSARRAEPDASPRDEGAALRRRVRELEDERDGLLAADEALRRQLAHNQSRLRGLEAEVEELREAVPKGRRKKKDPPPEPPPESRSFRLPWFLPSFYKSLEGKDRRAVERAFQAVLLFCTEGHSYPGLEVKQMGGQDTWSLRASLGLRVYFRPRGDGEIELLELADREEQHTTLRRLKDR